MPYPKRNDPDFCAGSDKTVPEDKFDPNAIWHRCPDCKRPIAVGPKSRKFFAHVRNIKRARRGDDVQETLIAHGCNTKEPRCQPVYAPSEEDLIAAGRL